jgi:type IV pilus assembly protein PilF
MMRYCNLFLLCCFSSWLMSCSLNAASSAASQQAANYNLKLGLAYLEQGEVILAKSKLLLALKEAPNDALACDAMAYFLEKTGESGQAQAYYLQALHLADANFIGAAENNYGTYLYRQKHYQEALRYFLKAAAEPRYLNIGVAYKNAGKAALALSDTELAQLYFKKARHYESGN